MCIVLCVLWVCCTFVTSKDPLPPLSHSVTCDFVFEHRVAKETLLSLGCTPKAHNKLEAKIARDINQLTTLESVMKSSIPDKNPSGA